MLGADPNRRFAQRSDTMSLDTIKPYDVPIGHVYPQPQPDGDFSLKTGDIEKVGLACEARATGCSSDLRINHSRGHAVHGVRPMSRELEIPSTSRKPLSIITLFEIDN